MKALIFRFLLKRVPFNGTYHDLEKWGIEDITRPNGELCLFISRKHYGKK